MKFFLYAFKGKSLLATYVYGKGAGMAQGLRNGGWKVFIRRAA